MAASFEDDDGTLKNQTPPPAVHPLCAEHGEKLLYFCNGCKEILCVRCTDAKHRGHDVVLLDTASVVARLSADAGRLRASTTSARAAEDAASAAVDAVRTSSHSACQKIEREIAELRAALDAKERKLEEETRELTQGPQEALEAQRGQAAGALQNAQQALEGAERVATQPMGATQFAEALNAWREVRNAIVATERCAAISVVERTVVWSGSTAEIRQAISRIPLPNQLPFTLLGVSFRGGPNCAISGPHQNVISKSGGGNAHNANAVGTQPLPRGISRWAVKAEFSQNGHIMVGVAPPSINLADLNVYSKTGWYFYLSSSTLYSGPPQTFSGKKYSSFSGRVKDDTVVVVEVDTTRGTLSFIVNGQNGGVAFEGLPADLVPVVILHTPNDKIEAIWA